MHFARIDKDGLVVAVIVADQEFIDKQPGLWIMTDYLGAKPKNYAGIGFKYDSQLDAFIPPKPFPSFTLDTSRCQWVAPVPYPDDGGRYKWDEDSQSWISLE